MVTTNLLDTIVSVEKKIKQICEDDSRIFANEYDRACAIVHLTEALNNLYSILNGERGNSNEQKQKTQS